MFAILILLLNIARRKVRTLNYYFCNKWVCHRDVNTNIPHNIIFILLIIDVYLPELLPNPVPAKYLLYDNLILGEECDLIALSGRCWNKAAVVGGGGGGGCSDLWGRRLEGWPNTAARLAGWRRVTRQMWFCMWWTGRIACPFPYRTGCPNRSCPDASWRNFQLVL
jgi:hypothetical protein